jgi:hypothetical protein
LGEVITGYAQGGATLAADGLGADASIDEALRNTDPVITYYFIGFFAGQ